MRTSADAGVEHGIRALTAVLVVLVALVAGGPGEDEAPASGAARLVPANALVYVHVSTDGERDATARASDLAGRFPGWPALRDGLLQRLDAPDCKLASQALRAADEAALALFDTGGNQTARSLVLIEAAGAEEPRERRQCGALSAEQVGDFLAIGQAESLDAARRLEAGEGDALADQEGYRDATDALPAGRVADGWATADGVRRLLAPQGGVLGAAGTLIDQPALRAAAFGVAAGDGEATLTVRSLLDEATAKRTQTFKPFEPTLAEAVPEGAMLYLGVRNLSGALERVLAAAGEGQEQLAPIIEGLDRSLLALFREESAVVISPALPAPILTLVTTTEDEAAARRSLRRLPKGLRDLFKTAVRDGKVVVSTQQAGVDAVLDDDAPKLADTDTYEAVLGTGGGGQVSSLVFLDFNRLLTLGEQTGLNDSQAYQRVKDDLAKVRAVGARSSGSSTESTAEITFLIP